MIEVYLQNTCLASSVLAELTLQQRLTTRHEKHWEYRPLFYISKISSFACKIQENTHFVFKHREQIQDLSTAWKGRERKNMIGFHERQRFHELLAPYGNPSLKVSKPECFYDRAMGAAF